MWTFGTSESARISPTGLLWAMLAAGIGTAGFGERASASAANWPQWRGPDGTGISQSEGLPTRWGPEESIVWKTPLPSWSGATPIIWEDHIFITSPTKPAPAGQEAAPEDREAGERGRGRGGRGGRGGSYGIDNPGGPNLLLLCLSREDGSVLWQRELDTGNRLHRKQNSSSPSPVTDGKHVWVVTGTGAVKAFDFEGREIWGRNLQADYGDFGLNWGYASSPLLHEGKLIIEVLHGNNTDDPSYLVALDSTTGRELWRQERPTDAVRESPDAYTTPAVLTHGGKTRIVVSGGDYVTAHDPASGEEVWRAGGLNPRKAPNYRIIASPVVKDGMIFAPSRKRPLLALRAGGTGDVTTSHLAWKWEDDGGPDVPTPISDGKHFYMVEDSGMVTCLDAASGERIWGPERTATGTVSASPLLADGKLYVTNERAITTVLKAGPEFEVLATNELDGSYTLSSPVAAGNQLFIRTSGFLYCIASR